MGIDWLLEADKISKDIVAIRRYLHMNPELGFEEHLTSEFVEKTLHDIGIKTKRVAGTGIIGILTGKDLGKTVGIRADMDALPLNDGKNVEYASKVKGKMHACGHDAHTAGLLGAAMLLAKHRESFFGQVKFLFQPAEETTGGALPMIKEGAMENPKVNAVFGLHCNVGLDTGKIGVIYGKAYASSDMFDIKIKGKSCHGASPQFGIDAIAVGAQVINCLQSIVSRSIDPLDSAVITVGKFNGGYQRNIIADTANLSGIIRTLEPETRKKIRNNFAKMVNKICEAYGAQADINIVESYPALVNDDKMVDLVRAAASKLIGEQNVVVVSKPGMGVEDFAYFLKEAPGAFFQLGVRNEAKGIVHPAHSNLFDIDEDALPLASAVLANIAFEYLMGNLNRS